eukprot:NODE_1246_length_1195_cov_360.967544.p1 GENE.NODE_1246_length_1195_cov_360.967544~~NODE_1246_length_1195_cov_360.967544.p1  ORF type:complete len:330 (-),score=111.53 NODE_1246_length_1195_cov_360.967544:188-1177(-)
MGCLVEHHDEACADVSELKVGDTVRMLTEIRRVLSLSHEAGLAPENAKLRGEAVGKTGILVRVDEIDGTVCVRFDDLGAIWFSATCIAAKDQNWGHLTEDRMEIREAAQVVIDYRHDKVDCETEWLLEQKEYLVEKIAYLRKQVDTVMGVVDRCADTAQDLHRRVNDQLEKEKRFLESSQALEARLVAAQHETDNEIASAQRPWDRLRDVSQSRNEMFDIVRVMYAEKEALRVQLVDSRDGLAEARLEYEEHVVRKQKVRHMLQREVTKVHQQRARERGEEERDLAWFSGACDSVARTFARKGFNLRFVPDLIELRDAALDVWSQLETA